MYKKSLLLIISIFIAVVFSACADNQSVSIGENSEENPVAKKVTVLFDTQQVTHNNWSETFDSGTVLNKNDLPELYVDGYIFQGWYYNDTKVVAGKFQVMEDITLTAKWYLNTNYKDTTPPADVTDLKVSLENNKPSLTWVNPTDEDFNTVIITYNKNGSTTSFGGHVSTGAGNKDSFTDTKALNNASLYTFTVQTIDYSGNISTGVSVKTDGSIVDPEPEPEPEPEPTPTPNPEPEPDFSKYKDRVEWFYGINGPKPDDERWIHPGEDKAWELKWDKSYGWYDVNKTYNVDKENDNVVIANDSNLCWAATAANLLHWWFKANEKYIKKYDEINKNKNVYRPDYSYPKQNISVAWASKYQESEIFQYFIDHFVNKGGWSDLGINWYISGDIPKTLPMVDTTGGGFFDDVFPKGKYVASRVNGLSKETFTKTMIDAIENHKAVGIVEDYSSTAHMVTIWGVEFDSNGYVKAIYVADNNVEQTTPPYTKNLTKRHIRFQTYEGMTATYTEMSLYTESYFIPAAALVVLDLGVKQWEEYFKNKGVNIN